MIVLGDDFVESLDVDGYGHLMDLPVNHTAVTMLGNDHAVWVEVERPDRTVYWVMFPLTEQVEH